MRRQPDGRIERVELRGARAFAEYSRRHREPAPAPGGEAIAGRIARKHCAGQRGTVTGAGILAAIALPPDPESDASLAVSWMLSSIRPHECAILVTRCGVSCDDLARHLRARVQQRPEIVRFLNQFAID